MIDHFNMEKIERLHRQVHKKFISEWNAVSPMNLSLPQANMLHMLHKEGIQRVSDLAERLCMTPGGLTLLCDKLEEKGLILRYRDEGDRRSVYLEISPQGLEACVASNELKNQLVEKMLQGISAEELQILDKLYTNLLRNLGEENV
ncbi:DNA-binding transcriptional regulator, MarR family [Paenibacillus sp. 1_12]|uniref:MarR family winged helix-turn-helix transcriptional regulator n=1 Tax=Paenibacillus sp. 1_12 TaxID=1566278 RepID=UPI0008E2E19D|nr:MarR family transcriptional regulator [Paenibacillus sp. 1_12]SFK74907.1 DNA-binding transcriptional regulator, MarR family [Paenibacillus sp. 1_12]